MITEAAGKLKLNFHSLAKHTFKRSREDRPGDGGRKDSCNNTDLLPAVSIGLFVLILEGRP